MLGQTSGNVKECCNRLDIPRRTYYNWRKADPDFATDCDIIIGTNKQAAKERRAAEADKRKDFHSFNNAADGEASYPEPSKYSGPVAMDIAAEHEKFLKQSMEEAGLWSASYSAQIRAASKLYASIEILFSQLDKYDPLQQELSREGNVRLTSNPIHEMIRRQMDTYTKILQSLGLNYDTKAKQVESDGMEEFLKRMNNDD